MISEPYSEEYSEMPDRPKNIGTLISDETPVFMRFLGGDPPGTRTPNQLIKRCQSHCFIGCSRFRFQHKTRWFCLHGTHSAPLVILKNILKRRLRYAHWVRCLTLATGCIYHEFAISRTPIWIRRIAMLGTEQPTAAGGHQWHLRNTQRRRARCRRMPGCPVVQAVVQLTESRLLEPSESLSNESRRLGLPQLHMAIAAVWLSLLRERRAAAFLRSPR